MILIPGDLEIMLIGFPSVLLYLDPTTGGILLQTILGGAAGGLVLVRLFWGKIKLLVHRGKGHDSDITEPEEASGEE